MKWIKDGKGESLVLINLSPRMVQKKSKYEGWGAKEDCCYCFLANYLKLHNFEHNRLEF